MADKWSLDWDSYPTRNYHNLVGRSYLKSSSDLAVFDSLKTLNLVELNNKMTIPLSGIPEKHYFKLNNFLPLAPALRLPREK